MKENQFVCFGCRRSSGRGGLVVSVKLDNMCLFKTRNSKTKRPVFMAKATCAKCNGKLCKILSESNFKDLKQRGMGMCK